MQSKNPLTPALSPSDGEREKIGERCTWSLNSDGSLDMLKLSLSPSHGRMGEGQGERGSFN